MNVLKLKEYREKMKYSQFEIANMLNMTQQGYSRWEKGISIPNAKQILMLCNIFKCSPNDLFGFRGIQVITSEEVF